MKYGYDWEELSGSYHDIGVAHGRQNAERMRYLLKEFHVDVTAPWREAELLAPLEKYLPGLAEEIYGIAEGSGMSLREVCGLSFVVDLGLAASACTGVVFASGPDGPVVGKTSDCSPGVQQEWLRPKRVRPQGAYAAVIHSHVGTPNTEMGMNEKGLSIGISGILSKAYNRQGVGWQQDIRGVLHACATTREAIDMLKKIPIRRAGYALVIGDATGDVAVVEKVVGALGVRQPVNNVVYEANHAFSPEVLPHVDASWGGDNGRQRMALLDRLCRDQAWPDFSLEGMIKLFCTHEEGAGMCQHGPALHSQTGFFMLPARSEMILARGHTCERHFEQVRF